MMEHTQVSSLFFIIIIIIHFLMSFFVMITHTHTHTYWRRGAISRTFQCIIIITAWNDNNNDNDLIAIVSSSSFQSSPRIEFKFQHNNRSERFYSAYTNDVVVFVYSLRPYEEARKEEEKKTVRYT